MAEQTVGFEWRPSPCVAQVLREQWPKTGYGSRPDHYQSEMRSIQIELIGCHFADMDAATRARAESTVEYLASTDAARYAQERLARLRLREEE